MTGAHAGMADSILGVTHTPPAFDVPAGACDCHVHVFGPQEQFPLAANRLYIPGLASVADLLALQQALHLERVVIVHPSPYGADNSCTIDALRQIGARARGVAVIDGATSDDALRDMHDAGVRGVRVNLETQGESEPAAAGRMLHDMAARAAPLGWHVQTYTNIAVIHALREAILALPTPLVIDHFGLVKASQGSSQPGFDTLLALLRSGKVWLKLSAPHRISQAPDYADAAAIVRALIDANPDRVLWGTDWPHPGVKHGAVRDPNAVEPFRPEDDGRALNWFAAWVDDAVRLRKVLVDNPADLYGF